MCKYGYKCANMGESPVLQLGRGDARLAQDVLIYIYIYARIYTHVLDCNSSDTHSLCRRVTCTAARARRRPTGAGCTRPPPAAATARRWSGRPVAMGTQQQQQHVYKRSEKCESHTLIKSACSIHICAPHWYNNHATARRWSGRPVRTPAARIYIARGVSPVFHYYYYIIIIIIYYYYHFVVCTTLSKRQHAAGEVRLCGDGRPPACTQGGCRGVWVCESCIQLQSLLTPTAHPI
jgi:hypothetical protein